MTDDDLEFGCDRKFGCKEDFLTIVALAVLAPSTGVGLGVGVGLESGVARGVGVGLAELAEARLSCFTW